MITWRESGGPPVTAPARTGFGSKVIQKPVAYELRGTVDQDFSPAGLTCRITLPLDDRVLAK